MTSIGALIFVVFVVGSMAGMGVDRMEAKKKADEKKAQTCIIDQGEKQSDGVVK